VAYLLVIDEGNNIRLEGLRDFNPVHIFECGQAFRWDFDGEGYVGVVGDKVIRVLYTLGSVVLENCTMEDYKSLWEHYFDLKRDYGEIKKMLSRDPVLKDAVGYGWGIRILNQDPWETLVSFIISANNNIVRIKRIIQRLCECFGEPILMNDRVYYTFPSPNSLVGAFVDRSSGGVEFGVKFSAVITLDIKSYNSDQCPICITGKPLVKPGSRNLPRH
jgi:N-glycosylase/DNA lyase